MQSSDNNNFPKHRGGKVEEVILNPMKCTNFKRSTVSCFFFFSFSSFQGSQK